MDWVFMASHSRVGARGGGEGNPTNQYLGSSSTNAHDNDINGMYEEYIVATVVLDILRNLYNSGKQCSVSHNLCLLLPYQREGHNGPKLSPPSEMMITPFIIGFPLGTSPP